MGETDPFRRGKPADALTRASLAGQWEVVARLAAALEARRKARMDVLGGGARTAEVMPREPSRC
jgi:hypothetical protein